MYSKYIVLKKTGAALHLWSHQTEQRTPLKERGQSLRRLLPSRTLFFLRGCLFSQIPYLHLALRQHFLKFLFFLPPKQKEKRKFPLTANSKPHEEQYKFFSYAKENI